MDGLDKLFLIVEALNRRYPDGDEPFRIVARLCEEAGELAREVNHLEGTGRKREKLGAPVPARVAAEAQDVVRCALALVLRYGQREAFEASIDDALARLRAQGHAPAIERAPQAPAAPADAAAASRAPSESTVGSRPG